jgi:pimeloyl-ACP methyl ester carboxylesterase
MATTRIPVIFIHGIWLHADSWEAWAALFRKAGYEPITPGWPGEAETIEETRKYPQDMAGVGIDIATDHYARLARTLKAKPIVIGHSFGGLIAQKLLGRKLARAAIAIDATQPKGVLTLSLVQLRSALPVLKNPLNRNRTVMLTPEQFGLAFGSGISQAEAAELYWRWAIAAPGKPLFVSATAAVSRHAPTKVNIANIERGPLLLIGGGKDRVVPPTVTRSVYRLYKRSSHCVTELKEFADRGHSLTIDKGWKDIATYSLTWLRRHSL